MLEMCHEPLVMVKFYKIQNLITFLFIQHLMMPEGQYAAAFAYLKNYKKIIINSNYLGPEYINEIANILNKK